MKKASTYETCLEHAFLFAEIFKQKNFQQFLQNLELRKIVQKNITKQLNQNRSKKVVHGYFFSKMLS